MLKQNSLFYPIIKCIYELDFIKYESCLKYAKKKYQLLFWKYLNILVLFFYTLRYFETEPSLFN